MIDVQAYRRPRSFDELWAAFENAAPPFLISAGATDLIPKSRAGLIGPSTWVDLRRIPALTRLEITDDHLWLGACLTHHQIATEPTIRAELPALARACSLVGSRQIRSLGTLGGNAANCSPCADSFLALTALDAEVVLRSPRGERRLMATEFPRAPGQTILEMKEIIEAFVVPRKPARRSAFLKLGPRKAVAVAKVSVAAAARLDEGRLFEVRMVLGSVAPTVLRVAAAEALLEGSLPDEARLREVARAVEEAIRPIDDVRSSAAYRRKTAGVLARRAVQALLTEGPG